MDWRLLVKEHITNIGIPQDISVFFVSILRFVGLLEPAYCANLRPLNNNNLAKAFIVKWSHIMISNDGSSISGIHKIFKKFSFNAFKKNWLSQKQDLCP